MKYSPNQGFVSLSALLIVLALVGVSGVGYGAYKYRETIKENAALKEQFSNQKSFSEEKKPDQSEASGVEDDVSETKIVYVPEVPIVSDVDRQEEINIAVEKALSEQAKASQVNLDSDLDTFDTEQEELVELSPISVKSVIQAALPDDWGGVYGAYELRIIVSAQGGDILIPMSTSDTVGVVNIGFPYTIIGGTFKGRQDSKISTCTLKAGNNCKIKDGQTKEMGVIVWLTPDEDGSGNYAVQFDQVVYFFNGQRKVFDVNQKTAKINLYY